MIEAGKDLSNWGLARPLPYGSDPGDMAPWRDFRMTVQGLFAK
jgi:hypothetical protein